MLQLTTADAELEVEVEVSLLVDVAAGVEGAGVIVEVQVS